MPFVGDILARGSVSVVGLAKNVGKTECLNYILSESARRGVQVGVTSIGIDGESVDQVGGTEKPEITLRSGTVFATSEKHYREKRLAAELLEVTGVRTSLGKLVVARALTRGKVLLSGPADTASLRETIGSMHGYGPGTVLVDGALSRLSPASPAVTDAMVLATGAAVSGNIPKLVRETKYVYDRIGLPRAEEQVRRTLDGIDKGVWVLGGDGAPIDTGLSSALADCGPLEDLLESGATVYVAGAVTGRLLEALGRSAHVATLRLVVRDFTRIFADAAHYYALLRKGLRIDVLQRSDLLAVCVNPFSPDGYRLDSGKLRAEMSKALGVPVYDVRMLARD